LTTKLGTAARLRAGLTLLGFLLLTSIFGCSHGQGCCQEGLSQRVLPPLDIDGQAAVFTAQPTGQDQARLGQSKGPNETNIQDARRPIPNEPAYALPLPEAIETAFQLQPRLRVYLESVEQARRAEDVAFAPFLPLAVAGYSVGGFDLKVGGNSSPLGPLPGFTFLPALGSIPIGLNINTGYELADLKLQWLICDFGRRLGRYRQAGLAADIAQLQSERAYQMVANEVSVAYY
jgi:outer membrane protein TolC